MKRKHCKTLHKHDQAVSKHCRYYQLVELSFSNTARTSEFHFHKYNPQDASVGSQLVRAEIDFTSLEKTITGGAFSLCFCTSTGVTSKYNWCVKKQICCCSRRQSVTLCNSPHWPRPAHWSLKEQSCTLPVDLYTSLAVNQWRHYEMNSSCACLCVCMCVCVSLCVRAHLPGMQ